MLESCRTLLAGLETMAIMIQGCGPAWPVQAQGSKTPIISTSSQLGQQRRAANTCIKRSSAKGLRSPARSWAVLGPTFHPLRNSLYPLALPPVTPRLQRFPGRAATHKSSLCGRRASPTSLQPLKADARVGMYGHTPRACVRMDPRMHMCVCAAAMYCTHVYLCMYTHMCAGRTWTRVCAVGMSCMFTCACTLTHVRDARGPVCAACVCV